MGEISFADVVYQSITFSKDDPNERLVLDLIDTKWVQRLRDISQTANTKLVYMFSEHSRFGHSVGVAYLACQLMARLSRHYYTDIEPYRMAVAVAALLHDIGHLAPGSHAAQRAWFPDQKDGHEKTAVNIIKSDPEICGLLSSKGIVETVAAILSEDPDLPPWTWEIISGGGWNVDRGNWCTVDSILAGVSYGKYNIPALTDAILLTKDKHLALQESRLDAMLHFAISRQAMYRQVYQHRVLLACDILAQSIVMRARDLIKHDNFADIFCDQTMQHALHAETTEDLSLQDIFKMRESWFKYHLGCWSDSSDPILADLSSRLLYRRLLKTVRINDDDDEEKLTQEAEAAVTKCGYDPRYYLFKVKTADINAGDAEQSILVQMDNGQIKPFYKSEPLYSSMLMESKTELRQWLALPEDAKKLLKRER